MSNFVGFSEEDLERIKSKESGTNNESKLHRQRTKQLEKIGLSPKVAKSLNRLLSTQVSEDLGDLNFEKCRLSLKSPDSESSKNNNNIESINNNGSTVQEDLSSTEGNEDVYSNIDLSQNLDTDIDKSLEEDNKDINKSLEEESTDTSLTDSIDREVEPAPDIVRGVANYTEDDVEAHRTKMSDLQLRQRLMEEQNKKRKEMLAKALADRAKRTEEEVQKLEKIKKELQVLDGQFSHDVALLRKKIDHACHTYADAEKHYLKIEKDFLQAKINLQKEKEKKELLTEHLCTLITHNETRKAQKLETLMLQLVDEHAEHRSEHVEHRSEHVEHRSEEVKCDFIDDAERLTPDEEGRVIVDGVDIRTGKMCEMPVMR